MPKNPAFPFVPLDPRRSQEKPRQSGLTMVSDYQLSQTALAGLLEVAGDYIDIFKVATGTARLFDRDQLIAKLDLLKEHQVQPFLGGQFQEYVLHHMGENAFAKHLAEAKAVGFEMIEISDNVISIDRDQRRRLIHQARDMGLIPVGEVGDKRDHSSSQALIDEINAVLDMGSAFAMVEGQELMKDGAPNEALIVALKHAVPVDRCMFELSTPRVGSTGPEIYAGKKFLIKCFGPDVNLGNITPDTVIETETTRLGLGSAGPLDLM